MSKTKNYTVDINELDRDDLEIENIVLDINKISKKDKNLIQNLDRNEINMITDFYYQIQDTRIRFANQLRAIHQRTDNSTDENENITYQLFNNVVNTEKATKKILDYSSGNTRIGRWLRSNMGIGPVLASALMSSFDITKAPTAGHFWSYAGLNDNNKPWLGTEKAKDIIDSVLQGRKKITENDLAEIAKIAKYRYEQLYTAAMTDTGFSKKNLTAFMAKPPYNLDLKIICWKVGEQFMKLANNEKSLYGKIYREKKADEHLKNNNGLFAEQAKRKLQVTNIDKKEIREIYESGKLPDGHILARAKRFAVKLFISHLFEAMYFYTYGTKAPEPYMIAHQGHVHYIGPEVPYESIL